MANGDVDSTNLGIVLYWHLMLLMFFVCYT